ncbi:MAG: hypothetical protein ACAI38_25045 [Myxococcota bacterium]|nr:hypothetical protein [Myxococcota bacterium]
MRKSFLFVVVLAVTSSAGAQTVAPLPATAVFRKVTDDARIAYNKTERPMVVFDLDGAIFDSRARTAHILREYADAELRTARPDAAQRLSSLPPSMIGYMLTDTLSRAGVTEQAVVNNAAVFWSQHFFDDDYVKYDEPVSGAVTFVRNLYTNGARIVYVSSRDVPRQLIGTVKALRDHGFPIGIAGTEVVLKPTQQTPDATFKQQLVTYLRQYGRVVATVDTQPANANDYKRVFPDAAAILLNGPRAPNQPQVAPGVTLIANYGYE